MREDMEMLAMNDLLPVKDVPLTSTMNRQELPVKNATDISRAQNHGIHCF
jgi:hypothetical protein